MYKHTVNSTNNGETITIVHTYTYGKQEAYRKLIKNGYPQFSYERGSEEEALVKFLEIESFYPAL